MTAEIGPSINDFHQDHYTIANEMIRCFKTSSSIICYELPWNHIQFNTQLFIRLKYEHIKQKVDIVKFYESQKKLNKLYVNEEYIYGIASTRGSQCNEKYAEAYEVVRWIF